MQLFQYHLRLRRGGGRARSVFIVFCAAVQKKKVVVFCFCTAAVGIVLLRDPVLLLILRLWQAPGTGLHGNGDAHAAASDGHVGDALPFVPVRAVTLDAGQEALLVETPFGNKIMIIRLLLLYHCCG